MTRPVRPASGSHVSPTAAASRAGGDAAAQRSEPPSNTAQVRALVQKWRIDTLTEQHKARLEALGAQGGFLEALSELSIPPWPPLRLSDAELAAVQALLGPDPAGSDWRAAFQAGLAALAARADSSEAGAWKECLGDAARLIAAARGKQERKARDAVVVQAFREQSPERARQLLRALGGLDWSGRLPKEAFENFEILLRSALSLEPLKEAALEADAPGAWSWLLDGMLHARRQSAYEHEAAVLEVFPPLLRHLNRSLPQLGHVFAELGPERTPSFLALCRSDPGLVLRWSMTDLGLSSRWSAVSPVRAEGTPWALLREAAPADLREVVLRTAPTVEEALVTQTLHARWGVARDAEQGGEAVRSLARFLTRLHGAGVCEPQALVRVATFFPEAELERLADGLTGPHRNFASLVFQESWMEQVAARLPRHERTSAVLQELSRLAEAARAPAAPLEWNVRERLLPPGPSLADAVRLGEGHFNQAWRVGGLAIKAPNEGYRLGRASTDAAWGRMMAEAHEAVVATLRADPAFSARFPDILPEVAHALGGTSVQRIVPGAEVGLLEGPALDRAQEEMKEALALARAALERTPLPPGLILDRNLHNFRFDTASGALLGWFDLVTLDPEGPHPTPTPRRTKL